MKELKIGGVSVGSEYPTFIIAEMSANHLLDERRALRIIDAAKDAGADAVKIQTYTADTITLDCNNDYFQIKQGTIWDGTTLHDLYKETYTPWDWQPRLKKHADEQGILLFSSPFDLSAIEFLEELDVPAHKIASFEIVDIPLVRAVARTGKPIIMSTGIAHLEDIDRAVRVCREEGNEQIALLKCTSEYPAPYDSMNLRTIPNLAESFDVVPGLSDHTMGHDVAVASIALGACIVEKHLTLARSDGGSDAAFSMEPDEFKSMVKGIRMVERALGKVTYELTAKQIKSRELSRSLFVCSDIAAGEVFTVENLRSVRPAFGLHTMFFDEVINRRAACDISFGTPLSWDLID